MWFDPSLLVLFCFAITCIIYGAIKSHTFLVDKSKKSNTDVVEQVNSLKLRNIIIFVVGGCAFLLLLFYVFNIIYYILLIFIIFVSMVSLFIVGATPIDFIFARLGWTDKAIRLPIVHRIPYSAILLALICFSIVGIWIMTGHWLVVNLLAWCIGVTQMSIIRLPNLKLSVILLGLFLLYDVFWVFISTYIFGESVMVAVATKMPVSSLPLTLSMPHIFEKNAYSLMGLGDIVLPGLFICFTYNFDEALKYIALYGAPADLSEEAEGIRVGKVSYFVLSIIGYTVGFLLTLIVFGIMQSGQPALLYLVPGVLIPVCVAAYFQGHFKLMWNGPPANIIPANVGDEEQALVSMNEEDGTLQQINSVNEPHLNISVAQIGGMSFAGGAAVVVSGPVKTAGADREEEQALATSDIVKEV